MRNDRRTLRFQLLAVLLGCAVPYAIRIVLAGSTENLLPLHITLFSSLVASILSVIAIRNLKEYPGVESVSTTLSSFSISYALLLVVLLTGRIDYARGLLIGSFGLCCLLFFLQELRKPSRRRLTIAVVRGGAAEALPSAHINWINADDPSASYDKIDAITVDLRATLSDAWERRLAELALADVPVYHIKHLRESLSGRVELEHLSETSYGTLSPPAIYVALKRGGDTILSIALLLVLLPILAAIALMIRLDSPGPAIFRQQRIGYQGRPFVVRKFRTMHAGDSAPNALDSAVTLHDDRRITRLGRFLRRSRLDELPQLINVIRGEMSLIGPRPEAEVLSKWYEKEIPFYRYRHVVRPGVTGWAQINQGHVTNVEEVTDKLHYDFYYIKNISLWLDVLIIMRTLHVMATGHGAK